MDQNLEISKRLEMKRIAKSRISYLHWNCHNRDSFVCISFSGLRIHWHNPENNWQRLRKNRTILTITNLHAWYYSKRVRLLKMHRRCFNNGRELFRNSSPGAVRRKSALSRLFSGCRRRSRWCSQRERPAVFIEAVGSRGTTSTRIEQTTPDFEFEDGFTHRH